MKIFNPKFKINYSYITELGFTKNESRVIVFLLVTFFIGSGIWIYQNFLGQLPVIEEPVPLVQTFEFKEKNDKIEILQESSIQINFAKQSELERLPGIGAVKASKIIEYRNKNGKFNSIDELENVLGIGKKTIEKISPYIYL